jgi:tetratricopeptide (TPR) repeat protein
MTADANLTVRKTANPAAERDQASERQRDFLYGLPALVAGLVLALFAFGLTNVHESAVVNFYSSEAKRFEDERNYDEALICFERLTRMRPLSDSYTYGKARILEAQGHLEQARVLLDILAPRDHPRYAPAHLLLANRALIALNQNPKALEDVEPHLLHCLKLSPGLGVENEVHAMLGKFYVAERRYAEAVPHLEQVYLGRPDVLLPLARTYAILGRAADARKRGMEARDHFVRQLEHEGNADNISVRLDAADAAFFLGDYKEAESLLLNGLARSNEVRLHAALSAVYVEWYKALEKNRDVSDDDRLALLERGLRHAPANPALVDCFLKVLRTGGPKSEQARAALRSTLVGGKAPAVVHFALGMDDWERGHAETARIHLREAVTLAPELLVAANNLAMLLAFGPNPDPAEALQIIDRVIERSPDFAQYRDTRGRILISLKRWQEALPELERALKTYPNDRTIHQALAEVYSHLGMPDIADEHKRRSADATSR